MTATIFRPADTTTDAQSLFPSLPPRYSRRLDDLLLDHLAEEQSPRYSRLFSNEYIPPHLRPLPIPEDETAEFGGLLRALSSPRSTPNLRRPNLSSPRITRPLHAQQLPPGPLSLTIDSGSIYPPTPSSALYHLPRALTWGGNEISLNLSVPAPAAAALSPRRHKDAAPRDLHLYVLRRTPFTNEVTLLPKRDSGKAAVMRGKRAAVFAGGTTWDVEVHGKTVLQYAKGRWRDAKGKVVAAERRRDRKAKADSAATWMSSLKPEITIFNSGVGELSEETTRHLIVAAWTARLWQARHKGSTGISKALVRGIGYFHHGHAPP